jgi:hypothetical protein
MFLNDLASSHLFRQQLAEQLADAKQAPKISGRKSSFSVVKHLVSNKFVSYFLA